jgi:hypothetical protein
MGGKSFLCCVGCTAQKRGVGMVALVDSYLWDWVLGIATSRLRLEGHGTGMVGLEGFRLGVVSWMDGWMDELTSDE